METRSKREIKREARKEIRQIRKRYIKRHKFLFFMILCLILGGLLGGSFIGYQHFNQKPVTKQKMAKKEKPKEKVSSAKMIMVGDNLIHGSVYKDANKLANYNGYDFKPMITYIKDIVKDYDIAYYNQETILGGTSLGLSDYPTFNSPQEAGDAMIDAGFNLVSLATNHTMDSGEKAVLASREYWNSKDDVLAVGSYASDEERNEVKIMKKNDISYTMLNYTYGTNGISVPSGKEYLVNVWPTDLSINDPDNDSKYQNYKTKVKEDIERVKDKVDVLIVAMHWGIEYVNEPTEYEKDMANYLAELGVNIIIGTHPHIIQPVTYIGNTIVFYSLGNFLSAQDTSNNYNKMVELMGSLEIKKTTKGSKSSISIENVKTQLLFNYYNKSTWRDFKVVPFSNPDISNYLSNYQDIYNTYKNVVQMYDDIEVEALS